jgi:hypothetical protein
MAQNHDTSQRDARFQAHRGRCDASYTVVIPNDYPGIGHVALCRLRRSGAHCHPDGRPDGDGSCQRSADGDAVRHADCKPHAHADIHRYPDRHTATDRHTVTPTATPSPTPKAADRLPKGPNLAFQLTIGEEELTQLVMGEAAQIVDAEYEGVAVKIHPDKIVVRLFAKFTVAGLGLDIEAEGVPVVVDGTVRFPIHRLTMEDAYQQLTEWVTLSVSNTMGRALYFLQPQREADIRAVHFTVTGVQLQEGAMVIEGITE